MRRLNPAMLRARDALGSVYSFSFAAIATLAVTLNVFIESFHTARFTVVLSIILLIQILQYPKILFCLEYKLYFAFVLYLFFALSWTPDIVLARNTLFPAVNFMLILVIFGSLLAFHGEKAVVSGTLAGCAIGAALYTLIVGFPFVRPPNFSYNAIASMYLFAFFISLLAACYLKPKRLLLGFAFLALLLGIATMSIKTNLGILLATGLTGILYFRYTTSIIFKNAFLLMMIVGALALTVLLNDAIFDSLRLGIDRILLGLEILKAGQNLPGYSAFDIRIAWLIDGLTGWTQNPVFGHGVEAFRHHYDITSHSTPVDLLYNYGLIGFLMFYAVFASILVRLARIRDFRFRKFQALILGAIICYLFVSLSSPIYYNPFLAIVVALAVAALRAARIGVTEGFFGNSPQESSNSRTA